MERRNLAALGGNNSHTAIGVAQYQQGLRLLFGQNFVYGNNHITNGLRTASTGCGQKVVRFANAQVLEEDFIQLEIVVLAGVHQNMFAMLIQPGHHTRQANNFRPGADHGHYFQLFHTVLQNSFRLLCLPGKQKYPDSLGQRSHWPKACTPTLPFPHSLYRASSPVPFPQSLGCCRR